MTDKNQAALDAFKRLCLLMPGELPYDKGHQSNLDMVLVREALQSLSSPSAGVDVSLAKMVDAWGNGLRHETAHESKMVKLARRMLALPPMREAPEEMTIEQFIDYLPRERGGGIYIDSEIVAGWATDYPHGLRIIEPPKGEKS